MALRVHAQVRIRIAGTIALKPSGREAMASLKLITLLIRRYTTANTIAIAEPITRPTEASEFENAEIKPSPSKNPPE